MESKIVAGCFSKAKGNQDLEKLLGSILGQSGTPEGFTVEQMMDFSGRSKSWCRDRLLELIKSGKVIHNGFTPVKRIDGQTCQKPVYKVV